MLLCYYLATLLPYGLLCCYRCCFCAVEVAMLVVAKSQTIVIFPSGMLVWYLNVS